MTRQTILAIATLAILCSAATAGTVNIALVPVGDPGNVADPLTGYGSVSYSYSIGKFDVTMGQYAAFLNAVATTSDTYGLWTPSMSSATPTYGITRTSTTAGYAYAAEGNSANVPVTYVSWGDAARFANWLQNGEPTGAEGPATTETGSYNLNGGTSQAALMAVTRSTTAGWRLPTVNEWYKCAYYVGGGTNSPYWYYATQSNDVPSNVLSPTGTNNANFTAIIGSLATQSDPTGWLTPVGTFVDSPGAYGTYDENGDVWQWNESVDGSSRGLRGGSFAGTSGAMVPGTYDDTNPAAEGEDAGFRVAYVPEPATSTTTLFAAVVAAAFTYLKRFDRRAKE